MIMSGLFSRNYKIGSSITEKQSCRMKHPAESGVADVFVENKFAPLFFYT